jgi:putative MATE family efflux protein
MVQYLESGGINMGNAFSKKFLKSFFVIALPMILQQTLSASVQLVDNFMVGSLGESAISAVASVNQIFFIGMLLVFGITGGAGIYTAQFFGDKDFDKLKQSYRLKIVCSLAVAFVILFISLTFRRQLIGVFLDTNSEAFKMAMSYVFIASFGVIPMSLNTAIGSTFREVAKPVYPTIATTTSIFINTFLNWVLIFGNLGMPALGVQGAAIATVIARSIETMIMLVLVRVKGSAFSTRIVNIYKINKELARKIFVKALPLSLNELLWSSGMTVLFFTYSLRGEQQLAGHSIAYTIFQLAFVIFGGIGVAVSVMVGNELGADNIDKAKQNSRNIMKLGSVIAIGMGFIVFILSDIILGFYNIDLIAYTVAKKNIATLALFFPIFVMNLTMFFSMRAGGDAKSTLIMDAVFTWLVPVPLALFLGYQTNMPIYQMFFWVNAVELLKLALAFYRYNKGYWLVNLTKA